MKKTGYLKDDRYLIHNTGIHHPESSSRLIAINKGIEKSKLANDLIPIKATKIDTSLINLVHKPTYVKLFEQACILGDKTFFYIDNQICKKTYNIANLAVGGILKTADKLMRGEIDNAFCAVRPPGHHAEYDQAMGFCFFNNIAILAKYLINIWKIKKIGIIDFDVHHGNGTQHIFESENNVFYYSIHQHPAFSFPGTGKEFDIGIHKGYGYTKNSTIFPGEGDRSYRNAIIKDLIPAFKKFKPDFILVSTGFDAHIDDNMSDIKLSTNGFTWIMETIFQLAEQYSNGKLISVLEGGYSLKRLPELAANHIKILLNKK